MEPYQRLDAALKRRIDELDLTWQELAAEAGVHEVTLRSIRRGDNRPSPRTKRRLDDALKWKRGSVDAVLSGGLPMPLEGAGDPGRSADEIADETDAELAEISEILERAFERRRRKPLSETQRRVTIEWVGSLERTIDAMDDEAG